MRPAMRNEVHVCDNDTGHHLSTDCWCEPTDIKWMTNKHGVRVLVVQHVDLVTKHRVVVVHDRTMNLSLPFLGGFIDVPINKTTDAPWITRVLSGPKEPPTDPNERKL